MIIRAGGGSGGLKKYLEHGAKVGRELHRDQLDQRIPLLGDLNAFELITSMQEGDAKKYDHFTMSFDENHISDELLQIAVDRFRDHALAAYPKNERDGILMYAEAHRPRVLSYTHSQNHKDIERFVHIHIGIGKKNLETGRYCDPLGYLGEDSDNQKYLDAFQESFNAEFGLSSPKDNPRIEPETAIDIYARYTGEKPDALGSFVARKSDFEINLQKQIIDRNITSWADFGKLLGEHGIASKMKEGKFGECWKIQLLGEAKAMRLKGVFFQKQFIERPTAEKVSIIMDKARVAYLEKMQPRKEPKYIAGVLDEWKNVKSKEIKYKSALNNKAYKEGSAEKRIEIIKKLESNNHGIQSSPAVKSRKAPAARGRLSGMPIRNLDGISRRAKMLLQRDGGVDVRAGESAESTGFELRQAAGSGGRETAGSAQAGTSRASTGQPEPRNARISPREAGIVIPGDRRIIQPSSVLAHVQHEQRERYEQAADKERYAEIRQNLDCNQLLNALSHSNGINPEIYKIIKSQDGSPRIQCGTRALTPNDFLTKELGLAWKDAAQILRKTYQQQIGKQVTKPRGKSEKSQLWTEFKAEQTAGKPALDERLKEFDEQTKTARAELLIALKTREKEALQGLTGASRATAKSLSKFHQIKEKADFSEQRRELRKAIKPIEWRQWLQARAQAGSAEALEALRKLGDTARAAPLTSVTGTIYLDEEEKERRLGRKSFSIILKHLEPVVQINGDITFNKNGVVILRDEGEKIAVLNDQDDDSIAAALLLAREKFGQTLTLTGSPEFQKLAVEIAVAQGIQINFSDPLLEAERQRLTAEKHQPRTPVSAPVASVPPASAALPAQAALAADAARDAERAAAAVAREAAELQAEIEDFEEAMRVPELGTADYEHDQRYLESDEPAHPPIQKTSPEPEPEPEMDDLAEAAFNEKWAGIRQATKTEIQHMPVVDVLGQRAVYATGKGQFVINEFAQDEAVPQLQQQGKKKDGLGR